LPSGVRGIEFFFWFSIQRSAFTVKGSMGSGRRVQGSGFRVQG
jgi:hypothetical protein